MVYCFLRSCPHNSRDPGITMHRSPRSSVLRDKWINSLGIYDEVFDRKTFVICSAHFTKDCFSNTRGFLAIKSGAIPTLRSPIPNQIPLQDDSLNINEAPINDFSTVPFEDDSQIPSTNEAPVIDTSTMGNIEVLTDSLGPVKPILNKEQCEKKRCCICCEEMNRVDQIPLTFMGEYTQLGLALKVLLEVGSTDVPLDYCCEKCSDNVSECFVKLVNINVSAYLTSQQKIFNDSLDDTLKKGCKDCGCELETLDQCTDHFMNHIIVNTKNNRPAKNDCQKQSNGDYVSNEHMYRKPDRNTGTCREEKTNRRILKERKVVAENRVSNKRESSYLSSLEDEPIPKEISRKENMVNHHQLDSSCNMALTIDFTKVARYDYTCLICHIPYWHRSLLIHHGVMVHNIYDRRKLGANFKPWCCVRCNKRYDSVHNLEMHALNHHQGKDILSFPCQLCPNYYVTLELLKKHIRNKHQNPFVHSCPHCAGKFLNESKFIDHMASHRFPTVIKDKGRDGKTDHDYCT